MIGIYKITNPKKKIYIGQSIDIEKRFKQYQSIYKIKSQIKIYNSLKKYGYDKHLFEVINICDIDKLNELERYYQELFSAIGKNGLNLKLTSANEKKTIMSEETKLKIKQNSSRHFLGKTQTNEAKLKISIKNKGKIRTDLQKQNISKGIKKAYTDGRAVYKYFKRSDESLEKMKSKLRGDKCHFYNKKAYNAKIIIDNDTKQIFKSLTDAAKNYNYSIALISKILSSKYKYAKINISYL